MSRVSKLAASLYSEELQQDASIDIPPLFTDYCAWLGVKLTNGQRALCLVAFDGVDPIDLDERDRDAAHAIFGDVERIQPLARAVLAAVCGGRGGKTYILVALRLVHGMYTRALHALAPGQNAVALVIAPNDKLRQEVVNYAIGAIRSKPELARTLRLPPNSGDIVSGFVIERPDGHRVVFEAGVATRGGYGGRGRWFTDVGMDEAAFFRDSSYKVNDEEIFSAASVRVLPGGQTIVASTPWAKAGLLYTLWQRNWGKPADALVAHAPTLLLNPSVREVVERGRAQDPDKASREFDAQFSDTGTKVFFEASTIEGAIDDALNAGRMPQPGETVAAGGDFGFRADSSALAIMHKAGALLLLGELHELRPTDGRPLKPSETIRAFGERLSAHGCSYMMADKHYRESVVEHLIETGVAFSDAPGVPADVYMRARALLREGRVRIPRNERLIQQLREVEGRPLPGGGMSIVHPRWSQGGHGDLVAALVLGLYQLGGEPVPEPAPDKDEQDRLERRKAVRERMERPWWKGGQRW